MGKSHAKIFSFGIHYPITVKAHKVSLLQNTTI